jgi:hypothetical protein
VRGNVHLVPADAVRAMLSTPRRAPHSGGAAAERLRSRLLAICKGESSTRAYMVRGPASGIPGNSTTPRRMRGCTTRSEVAFTATRSLCFRLTASPHRLTAVHQLGMISTPSRVGNRRDRGRGLKARVEFGVAS